VNHDWPRKLSVLFGLLGDCQILRALLGLRRVYRLGLFTWLFGSSIFEIESLRQVEVELDGSTLPFAFERIGELEVELIVSSGPSREAPVS
jgi:hypothetical protein